MCTCISFEADQQLNEKEFTSGELTAHGQAGVGDNLLTDSENVLLLEKIYLSMIFPIRHIQSLSLQINIGKNSTGFLLSCQKTKSDQKKQVFFEKKEKKTPTTMLLHTCQFKIPHMIKRSS